MGRRTGRRRVRSRAVPAQALALLSLLFLCGSAHAAPSAVIDRVHLLPRADASSAAWSKRSDTYSREYVYPTSWLVRVSGCSSQAGPGQPVLPATLTFRLEPLDGQPGAVPIELGSVPGQCVRTAALPALGRWRVTLTVTDAAGALASTAVRDVTLRDMVVAAVGDSMTSGEGNRVKGPNDARGWIDPQCHRSYDAWPAMVARALENDSTTVTYLSFACSGADIEHLTSARYGGMADGAPLKPQLTALRDLLGDPMDPATRPVDALLGTTGINTLDVADSLRDCVLDIVPDIGPFDCQKDFTSAFRRLPDRLDDLELTLGSTLRVAQVDLLGYPSRIMTDASDEYPRKITGLLCGPVCKARAALCGVFANTRVSDKQWMTKSMDTVNRILTAAAFRHGWTVTPTKDRFRGHGYCAPPTVTWFRSASESLRLQHNLDGTAHPLRKGHAAMAEAVLPRVRLDSVAPAPESFVIDIRRLNVRIDSSLRGIERPRQVGEITVSVAGAARISCSSPGRAPVAGRAVASAAPCRRLVVGTTGSRVVLNIGVNVRRLVGRPRREPVAETRRLQIRHVLRRADNWGATVDPPGPAEQPVRRFATGRPDRGELRGEYTITRPTTIGG